MTNLRKNMLSCVLLVGMLMLTGCLTNKSSTPALDGGYLTLEKGQTYTAKQKVTFVDLEIVEKKDRQIRNLLKSLEVRKTEERID